MNESTFPFTKRAFKNNEKDNEHTKNALELAKMYGTYDEFKKMKQITITINIFITIVIFYCQKIL